ncbi:MAG: hypothetical protein AAGU75_18570 [Bacillota bacterium]
MVNLVNQTMVDAFFGCIGIFIGFLQAAFFQLTIEDKARVSPRSQRLRNKLGLMLKRNPSSKYQTKQNSVTLFVLFFVQELLLFSFFVSLIYIFLFGTYVCRESLPKDLEPGSTCYSVNNPENCGPKTEDETLILTWFERAIDDVYQFTNTIVIFCVGTIFTYNTHLLLRKIRCSNRFLRWFIPFLFGLLVILIIWQVVKSAPTGYIEKTSLYDIVNSIRRLNHMVI